LNFSRSRSELDLAARRAIQELDGDGNSDLEVYADASTEKHCAMVEQVAKRLHLTSLKYQHLDDLISAIGLSKDKLCTYCWDGCGSK
jgi:amidophosphoribosyltransferase